MIGLAALLAAAALQGIAAPPAGIDGRAYRADVELLASDAFEGRRAGDRGAAIAARYLASRMAEIGLRPAAPGYLQEFPMGLRDLGDCALSIGAGGAAGALDLREDFWPIVGSAEGSFEGDCVFVGYGITAPECAWDDYVGIDARGKVAVALRHEPFANDDAANDWRGARFTRHATFLAKAKNAADHGAAALLVVPDLATFPEGRRARAVPGRSFWTSANPAAAAAGGIASMLPAEMREGHNITAEEITDQVHWLRQATDHARRLPIPALWVAAEASAVLLDAEAAEREILAARAPRSRALAARASGKVAFAGAPRPCWNVLGALPGSDPALREEWVLVGGHYDHVGKNAAGEVWNGADDNASGTAAVLAIAAALAKAPPRRSVLFVGFSAEEVALLGSFWLAEHLPAGVDPARVVAMVNCDMIGRGSDADKAAKGDEASKANEVFVAGMASSPAWAPIVRKANAVIGLETTPNETFFDRSDQAAFYFRGIPVLFFNTGEHGDYHGKDDLPARLDFAKAERVAGLALRCVRAVADLPGAPPFVDFARRVDLRAGEARPNWMMGRTPFLERSDL